MYTNILFATDLLTKNDNLNKKAAQIAKQFNATLYLLHVIELPASIQLAQGLGFTELANPSKEDARTVLSLMGENLGIPESQQYVEIGSVKEIILQKMKDLKCQLIIIGSHSTSGVEYLLGSTAHAIINRSSCDVMTLRSS